MPLPKRKMDVTSDINVTPMVDVMLVLLIIFMVITPMLQKGVSVELAKTDNPISMQDADKEDALLVAVMMAASAAFATPFGYQTNVLVYKLGGYSYADFVKIGVPLNLLTWLAAVLVIPFFFPF